MSPTTQAQIARQVLSEETDFGIALGRISSEWGRRISSDALRALFRREGLAAPSSFLGEPVTGRRDDTMIELPPAPMPARFRDTIPMPSVPERDPLEAWLIWSDAHVPFEDKRAFDLVLEVGRALRPHGTAIIGDFADMLTVSSHPKTPAQSRWQLKDEVAAVNTRLDQVDALGCEEKIYFAGNHCIRGQRLAMAQMMGLFDSLDPSELFRLTARGWSYHPYRQHAKIGRVNFVHDVGFCGKYAAHHNGAAFESSTVQGHTHGATLTYFGNVLGERHVSATIGWLGSDEAADYMAPIKITRNWQKAFAMMWVERETRTSHVQIIPIIDYRCVVNGRLFQG